MRTSNPALNPQVFQGARAARSDGVMTVDGAVNKIGVLLLLLLGAAMFVWNQAFTAAGVGYGDTQALINPGSLVGYMAVGGLGGFVCAIALSFKPVWAPYLAPGYAVLEGLFIGAFAAYAESRVPGVPMQGALLTFCILGALLFAYKAGLVKATEKFRTGIIAATGGVFLVYLLSMVMGMFGVALPMLHGSGTISILFSLAVVVIAALNLVLDFDFIEEGARMQAPKHMEWYAAFGLLVTLVWLYIEVVKLLLKLSNRDD